MSFINATILASAASNTHSIDLESGSTQYLSITDAAQTGLDILSDISLECWVKLESAPGEGVVYVLFSKWTVSPTKSYYLEYSDSAGTTRFRFFVSSNGTNSESYVVNHTLSTATWTHVAVTWDASASTAKFYVNGTQTGTDQVGALTSIANTAAPVEIGASNGANPFDGLIDDVRIWDDIRTVTEISDNKSLELVGDEANLQAYWQLNNALTDSTANANTLTNNNAAVFSTDVPF